MKERPILFSGPMVRAILAGTKKQTRRVLRTKGMQSIGNFIDLKWCPYGMAGDRLWVRETFRWGGDAYVPDIFYRATSDGGQGAWKPSIFLKRKDCRLVLEVIATRTERLQDITEDDARSEGCEPRTGGIGFDTKPIKLYRTGYVWLWNEINGKRASWASNPWVWVVEFKVVP